MAWQVRILFVTAEVAPFARTGGLGDVCGTLPSALAALGHDVRVIMPLYRGIRDQHTSLTTVLADMEVPLVSGPRRAGVWQGQLLSTPERTNSPIPPVPVYFVENDDYFDRPGLYGDAQGDYPDNPLRFLFFARAALALAEHLDWVPDVVHCHDWHTGLIPAFLRFLPGLDARLREAKSVFTIHNLAYQGIFPSWVFDVTGLPPALYQPSGMEFYGGINFLKAGLLYADRLTTVSPSYAEEICTPLGGFGLDGLLRERRDVLSGIVNGADYGTWDPVHDPLLAAPYSVNDLAGKEKDKLALLRSFGLPEDGKAPVLSMVTRLVDQKGVDIVANAMSRLLALNARFVMVGSGELRYEQIFADWVRRAPERVGVHLGFSDALAHQVQAGSDMLLMPSRYEPCGLTQLYALRYGTIPIVRAVGGLKDTVVPFVASTGQGTGFVFEEPTADALLRAVVNALAVYREKETWSRLMQRAMQQDFSWGRSAVRYRSLYRQIVPTRRSSSPVPITFGTSGWRALVAEDFTQERVATVSQAIAEHLLEEQGTLPHLLVAHDTRFLGREFAETAAATCTAAGLRVTVSSTPLPTPVVAFEILRRRLSGAINITASHNPYRWNGVKFSPAWGGPALPETTRDIARRANAFLLEGEAERLSPEEARRRGLWNEEEVGDAYRQAIERLVDVDCIRRSGVVVAVDLLWGTAQGFLDRLLRQWQVIGPVFHAGRDPYFGGGRPEPVPECMTEMVARLRQGGVNVGVGCDCDADRFGVCDSDGTFFVPNVVLPLLADYLVTHRGLKGKIGRSVATSHLLDAVARHHGLELVETPVGFKYLGEMIARDELLIGGEESGGLSIRDHVPEKDGILACLLVVEMVARTGKSLGVLLADLFARVGPLFPIRRDVHLTTTQQSRLKDALASPPTEVAGLHVERIERMDGLKLYLREGQWLLVRASGTEPVVRLYAEAEKAEMTEELLDAGQRFFLG